MIIVSFRAARRIALLILEKGLSKEPSPLISEPGNKIASSGRT